MPPLVSVIIPTYERLALLRQTVESAFAQTCDYDLWLRVSAQHRIAFLDEPLTIYRDHHPSIAGADNQVTREAAEILMEFTTANPSIWKEWARSLVRDRLAEAISRLPTPRS